MNRRATGRNWRLEAAAWAAAIGLVLAALAFSAGRAETEVPSPSRPPAPTAPLRAPLP